MGIFRKWRPFSKFNAISTSKISGLRQNSRATELGILPRVFGNIRPALPVDGNFIRGG
jgi:hypothetical protein